MLKNRFNGCHGNHAFFHSTIEFIFEDKNSLHFWGPNERFGTHEKLSWGCKVGQISSRGNMNVLIYMYISYFSLLLNPNAQYIKFVKRLCINDQILVNIV